MIDTCNLKVVHNLLKEGKIDQLVYSSLMNEIICLMNQGKNNCIVQMSISHFMGHFICLETHTSVGLRSRPANVEELRRTIANKFFLKEKLYDNSTETGIQTPSAVGPTANGGLDHQAQHFYLTYVRPHVIACFEE
jgi:hypothetical protein